jgi:phosphoglycerate kinase
MTLKAIKNIDLQNKKVFIRCDFNVPLDEDLNISDDRRIRSALNTIRECLDSNCSIILASHLGRPKNGFEDKFSLRPVAKRLQKLLHQDIILANDVVGEDTLEKAKNLKAGEILLLENLRFESGETKNSKELSQKLSSMAQIYINDAFGVSHRKHSSVYGITDYFDDKSKCAGYLLSKEINFFNKIIAKPDRPLIAVVGGSKVSSKLAALKNLLPKVDKMIIGGGMAFTFLKALGYDIGNSLVENDLIDDAISIMNEAKEKGVKLYLPVDVVAADKFASDANIKITSAQEIPSGWMGLDIGPASTTLFKTVIEDAHTILWNGPMGVYEIDKFSRGSKKLSHAIASSFATTVVGGGDTADLVQRTGDEDEMSFISTGGGASLELLEGKVLPGVEVLLEKE